MGASILIVEDEAVLATDLAESLKDHGYEVLDVVSTGEDAVEKSLQLKPQIVLIDIHLKGHLDGIQAAQQIRESLDIPVIYLTAYTDSTSLERAKLTEPHGYLVKPVDEKELRITLEMALYKSHAEKQLRESEEFHRRLVEHSPMGISSA
jgi:CheY-like chemotaxis protein